MDRALGHPAGPVLKTMLPARLLGENDNIAMETSSVRAGLPSGVSLLRATHDPIDSQDHLIIQSAYSTPEQHANQSCLSLETCIEAELAQNQHDSRKRKSPAPRLSMSIKKIRVDEGVVPLSQSSGSSRLPPEIWQHIFIFLPPKMLGRLLSVDRYFNCLLDPFSKFSYCARPSVAVGSLPTLKPEVIWQFSRRRFWPNMPTPLRDLTELRMWQLACQSRCQFCGKASDQFISSSSSGNDPSTVEYKLPGSRPLWPFALTSCEPCIAEKTIKELALFLESSIPSFLIPALPFVLLSDDMHVIPSAMLQTGRGAMTSPISKIFLPSHVAAIQEEFSTVRRMGDATAEEWLKGLEGRGKENRTDSLRWEKFEMSGGLRRMRQRLSSQSIGVVGEPNAALRLSRISDFSSPVEIKREPIELPWKSALSATPLASTAPSLTRPREKLRQKNRPGRKTTIGKTTFAERFRRSNQLSPEIIVKNEVLAESVLKYQIDSKDNAHNSKTRERAEELKAARRAEIERKAMELDPPLPAYVLAAIPAFRAAIQIASPLSDTAWDLLKPRLIAHRENADRKPQLNKQTADNVQVTRRQSDRLKPEIKQQIDNDWDSAQTSIRARILALADDAIRDKWEDGLKVNEESSPQFAADVLVYVRRQFYAEIERQDAIAHAAGQSPVLDAPNGPYIRKLTLENMKLIFDVKIKPFTEPYGKELFYCHGCQNNNKKYGLDGVVQHYSAKHTNSLGLGNVVVYWRAEWPREPPFHPQHPKMKTQPPGNYTPNSNGICNDVTPTPREQPFHQEGALPSYGQSLVYSQYDTIPMQTPNVQDPFIAAPQPTEYTNSFTQNQALHHQGSTLELGGTLYQGPPELTPGAEFLGPTEHADFSAHQSHSYTPYQSQPAPEYQFYHQSQLSNTQQAKLADITYNSIEMWRYIYPAHQLPKPIRVFVTVHHVVTKYRERFSEEPPLGLFIDALCNNQLRPFRHVHGLLCKTCHHRSGIETVRSCRKRQRSLLDLARHFQDHIEEACAMGTSALSWGADMIHLPDLRALSDLSRLKRLDIRMPEIVKNSFLGIDMVMSLPLDQEVLSSETHPTAVPNERRQRRKHQRHVRFLEMVQDTSQHNVRRNVLKASPPPQILGADHRSTDKASIHARASNLETSAKLSSAPISLAGSNGCESLENVEDSGDDDFDLIAGLELQLDQQALSIHRDTPLA
ncbi:hypothetical protein GGS21DRAFT_309097 [Xylaria nigripes]|nr:hypothetical protein GGS21DRAFT_309097 [Xylaria nigripes]